MAPHESESYGRLRNSVAHVLAQAIVDLFPAAKLGSGALTRDGFYYDVELSHSLTPDRLQAIEQRMRSIIAAGDPIVVDMVDPAEAWRIFADQPYKLEIGGELIRDNGRVKVVKIDSQGCFVDLSHGPHLE